MWYGKEEVEDEASELRDGAIVIPCKNKNV